MTTFIWKILQLERIDADGFVVNAKYRITATEGSYSTSRVNTTSWEQESGETYIPYDTLTEEVVLGWVQSKVGKDKTEAELQAVIDLQKTPLIVTGVPWSTPSI